MVVTLDSVLEAALHAQAKRCGVAPETLAVTALRERFLSIEPHDEWERRLFNAALDCGVSVSNSALSSDGLYE